MQNSNTLSPVFGKTFPHKLTLSPSRRLSCFRLALILGAVFTLFKLALPFYLCILPICYYFFTKSQEIDLIEITPGTWAIYKQKKFLYEGILTKESFLSTPLILLNLKEKISGKSRHTLILSDMLPAEHFRRLKVHLLLTSKTVGK